MIFRISFFVSSSTLIDSDDSETRSGPTTGCSRVAEATEHGWAAMGRELAGTDQVVPDRQLRLHNTMSHHPKSLRDPVLFSFIH